MRTSSETGWFLEPYRVNVLASASWAKSAYSSSRSQSGPTQDTRSGPLVSSVSLIQSAQQLEHWEALQSQDSLPLAGNADSGSLSRHARQVRAVSGREAFSERFMMLQAQVVN